MEFSLSHSEMISRYLLVTVFWFSSPLKDSAVIHKNEEMKDNFYLKILLDNVTLWDIIKHWNRSSQFLGPREIPNPQGTLKQFCIHLILQVSR